jgi:NAD(P)-dependent dehydrogenase (short-subunit alcohol dehydrogenase family)
VSATPSSQESAAGAVLVTGASTGIGAACALGLDRLGMRVFAGVRRATDGAALQRQASPLLTAVAIDVTDANSIAGAARTIGAVVGSRGLAGLVNNAGIVVPGPLEFLPLTDLRRQLEVNVIGQIAVTQAMLPLLRAARGRIVNMGSIGGRMATPFVGAYAASKFALEALTDALRVEVRPWRIGVSIIEPGAIATPIWQKSAREGERLREAMPAEATRLYGQALEALRKGAARSERDAIPPEAVVAAVVHALTAPRPRTRYVIGRRAKLQAVIARWVPDRARDRLLTRVLRLPDNA